MKYLLNYRRLLRILILLCILGVASFVIQPQRRSTMVRKVGVATQVRSTLQPYDPQHQQNSKPSYSLLSKAANKITSLLPYKIQPKDALTRMGEQERRRQRQALTHDMKDSLRPFPWPIRAFGNSIVNTMDRAWRKESPKAEVLIADAYLRIGSDRDARAYLGEPITTGRILSQSVSTRSGVSGKKRTRIQVSFEVIGSHKTGVATLVADKYARGHIVALRVRVAGISYDIDVS